MKTKQHKSESGDAGMWSMRPSAEVRERMEAVLQVSTMSRSEIIERALMSYFPKLAEQAIKDAEANATALAKLFRLSSK